MNIKERHEDSDDQARRAVIGIPQGIAQRVGSAFDPHDAVIRTHRLLIEDDSIRGREKVAQVRIRRTDRIPKEVVL